MARTVSGKDRAFRIIERPSWRTGEMSWQICGWLRGVRIREGFPSKLKAEARRLQLEQERLGQQSPEAIRATWLTTEQLKACELLASRIPDPDEIRLAAEWWLTRGRDQSNATKRAGDIRLDDAAHRFLKWLEKSPLRPLSKRNLQTRVRVFVGEMGDIPLVDLTPERIEAWLESRKTSPVSRDNDRRAASRFLSWCCERRQRFLVLNPCAQVRVELPEKAPPKIYTLREVMRLLAAARRTAGGRFLKVLVLGLFGSMRPFEALAFRDEQVIDGEIRIEGLDSKTPTRTITADPVLLAWLRECGDGPVVDRGNHRLAWDRMLKKAKLPPWIADGVRHTSVSHFFRRCGSYGLTAEHAGNSEKIIRQCYQARTTTAESAAYWALFPDRESRRKARAGEAGVVQFPVSSKAQRRAR